MNTKDIMIKDVRSVSPDISAQEALDLLQEMRISGLPVIDAQNNLVGMFTEKDILSYILPSYIENVGRFVYQENSKAINKKFKELVNIKVDQIMRREVVTTTEDTTLGELARIMLTQKNRRLLVLDKLGKVVGIVTRHDVLKAMASGSEAI
ncbi:MAG: CBS domain-containing protein [Candidatus Omnitrophota bacterium]|nr:CBS domain-containing protein [Candidatus Omnitrophota bacterium]